MTNSKVDWFFNKSGKWQGAYQELRETVLDCGLSNIFLIHGFKAIVLLCKVLC